MGGSRLRTAGDPLYWLLVEEIPGEAVGRVCTYGRTLPVFSSEKGAQEFLRSCHRERLKVRQSSAGELLSLLYGPLSGAKRVAMNPSTSETDGPQETIGRRSFTERLLGGEKTCFDGGYAVVAVSGEAPRHERVG